MATKQIVHPTAPPSADPGERLAEGGRSTTSRLLLLTQRVMTHRAFFACLLVCSLLLYVQNAPHTVDYQEFDEAAYFYRAYLLTHGNVIGANIADPGAMPIYIGYYALWYLLLQSSYVYPWVLTSSIVLLGLGAYALLSRIFYPFISWVLALFIVSWSVPFAPNSLYIFATACLWLSLAVLGRRVWQRGLAAALVLLCVLVRPEFLACALVLILLLALYEAHLVRHHQLEWRALATAYAPLVTLLLFGLYLYLGAPQTFQGGSSYGIAWSYTDFYRWVHPQQFDPLYSYSNPWRLFQKDFGPQPAQHVLTQTLIAMTRNPAMLTQYLSFESTRLIASFGTATLDSTQWSYDHLYTQPVLVTQRDTQWFLVGVAGFAAVAAASYLALRRRRATVLADRTAKVPVMLGLLSLAGLAPFMILINPHQRFYMLYPLVLLPVGLGISAIVRALTIYTPAQVWLQGAALQVARGGTMVAVLLLMLAYLPQPFVHEPPSGLFDAMTLAFLRHYVPQNSMIIGEPADSYADYLSGDGYYVTGVEAGPYEGIGDGNVIYHVLQAYPNLDNVYVLFNNNIPYGENNPWFAAWNSLYPALPITLVAQRANPYLALYRLPPELGARVSYLQLLDTSRPESVSGGSLPPYSAMDFSTRVSWMGDRPQNEVTPTYWQAWGWGTQGIVLYPDLPGVWAIRAHTVMTTLPEAWSGKTVVFAATFAPWEVNKPGADGTQLVMTVVGTTYHLVVQLPNSPDHHWQAIVVNLPHYADSAQLQVTVLPRSSLLWDDTLLSFIGLANGDVGGPSSQQSG